jgi:hypothetical protein
MGIYIIEYAQDRNFVIGVTDQILNSAVVLKNKKGLPPRNALWDVNIDTGTITLNSSGGTIGLGVDRLAAEAPVKLKYAPDSIRWDFLSNPGFIVPVTDHSLCLDNKGRSVTDGNTIWLYPVNGSPAQQWVLVSLNNLKAFE